MNVEAMKVQAAPPAPVPAQPAWQPSRTKLRVRLYFMLLVLDLACIFGGMFFATSIYDKVFNENQWVIVAGVLAPIYVVTALNARAYSSSVIIDPTAGILRALQSLLLAAGIVILVAFYLKASASFSRGMIAIGISASLVSLALVRWQFLRRARALVGGNPYSVALIVDGNHALDLTTFSFVIHAGSGINPDEDCPVMFDRLAAALRGADRVVIACPPERRQSWVRMLKGANIRSELIAPELGALAPLALAHCGDMPTLVVAEGPLGKFDSAVKRGFDIVLTSFALLVLAPLMLVVAFLIKLSSPGPVFFVQTRIGQGNRMFRMYKFRSMRVDQGDSMGHRSASRDDDRITPIGRFIRGLSIDELPQLFNVLARDMSIVGPRPHALGSRAEDQLFWEVDDRYWHRHAAKPGLTGLAQVRGFRGATVRKSDLTNRLQADLEYLHHWSLWRDIVIIIQTFRVLIHRNAY